MSKVLITGSLGYIGSVLSNYLCEKGHDCIAMDTGFFEDALLYPCPPKKRVKVIKKDVREFEEADLMGIEVVVHLAGISNDPVGNLNPATVYDPTRHYSLTIARLCKKLGIRFIFASSCSVYGIGDGQLLDEDSSTNPQTYYSLNKQQIEQDLVGLADTEFSPVALRFATIFGLSPRIRFDVVINMLVGMAVANRQVVLNSDGQAWRPNLHILDACEAIRCAIKLEFRRPELLTLNIGSEENNMKILDIAGLIITALPGTKLAFLSDDPTVDKDGLIADRKVEQGADRRTYRVAFGKIGREMPEFRIGWSVKDGISEMVSGLQAINFDSELFSNRGFYRLQRLESLHAEGLIDDELRWN
jgi:nucleoside-diphosphate-sugar epimerase